MKSLGASELAEIKYKSSKKTYFIISDGQKFDFSNFDASWDKTS